MNRVRASVALIFASGLLIAACDNNNGEAGGEAETPAQNIPESDPEGVGGTSSE